jgi:hypothetical protein
MNIDARKMAGTCLAIVAILLFVAGTNWMVKRKPIKTRPVSPLDVAAAADSSLRAFSFLAGACLTSVASGWILSRTQSRWRKVSVWVCFWAAGNGLAIIVIGDQIISGFDPFYPYPGGCINNLVQINSAKEQWALETHFANGATPSDSDLFGASRYIAEKPHCPWGGEYIVNPVGVRPTCTVPGHTLP